MLKDIHKGREPIMTSSSWGQLHTSCNLIKSPTLAEVTTGCNLISFKQKKIAVKLTGIAISIMVEFGHNKQGTIAQTCGATPQLLEQP